ncbi:hypothetical protein NM449_17480 (plasmid) [Vibrio metschnikovii]|uniref:hypothetical protein n=1 Tax=Vibrio metschnikovii TaxID=28172 RepID=UPI00315CC0BD
MVVIVQATTNIKKISEFVSQPQQEEFRVEPIAIYRSACSLSHNTGRYTYRALFEGLSGMISVNGEQMEGKLLEANINRKRNPKFKPPQGNWSGKWQSGFLVFNRDKFEEFRNDRGHIESHIA